MHLLETFTVGKGFLRVRRRDMGILVVAALFGPLLWSGLSLASNVEVIVTDYPKEVQSRSSFYVRIRINNHGNTPVRPCDTSAADSAPIESCVAMVYRKGKRPPQFTFSRVEVAPVLRPTASIRPGGVFEGVVEIPTPDRKGAYVVYLYAVVSEGGHLAWIETPLTVNVAAPPRDVARRLLTSRALLALYVVGTVAIVWRVYKKPVKARRF